MSFSLDLSRFTKLTEDKMETIVKKSFIGLSVDIIKDTPVDSGRLRNNWFPAINKYSAVKTDNIDKSGSVAISNVTSLSTRYKLGDTITLTNNLPYASRIEFLGWSKLKAPKGMVRINVTKWQKIVDDNARKAR